MEKAVASASRLLGEVTVPPSKSDVHRAVLCAALCRETSKIFPVDFSDDITATVKCVGALGAEVECDNGVLTVNGSNLFIKKHAQLYCGESGSTLRFLVPIAAAGGVNAVFNGGGMLPMRPIGVYLDALPKKGVVCKTKGGLPLEISGALQSGEFTLPGNVSSQFITGLLLALPLLDGDSRIVITGELQSTGYVDMTIDTMEKFGVHVEKTDFGYAVAGGQSYHPAEYKTQGDWSQAAFFMCAGAINGKVTVKGVDINSRQGDREIADILRRFGAKVSCGDNSITVEKSQLNGITIDAGQIPDLVPVLAVCGALANGVTKITNAARLRIKECDRLAAMAAALNAVGGRVTELPDGLEIHGTKRLCGGEVMGCNDHRIVMSMCVAALACDKEIYITDPKSINKSYPRFFEDFNRAGGIVNVVSMG